MLRAVCASFLQLVPAGLVGRGTAFLSSEGGFSVVDDGFFTAGKPYFHDIEADGDAAIQESQPVPGTAAQQFAFSPVHGSGGRAVCQGGIAFHLDEYQYIALTADDIHLTGISPA